LHHGREVYAFPSVLDHDCGAVLRAEMLRHARQLAADTYSLQAVVTMKTTVSILYGLAAIGVFLIDRIAPSDMTTIALGVVLVLAIPVYAWLCWSDRRDVLQRVRFWFHRR
jgi:hypothetical protein